MGVSYDVLLYACPAPEEKNRRLGMLGKPVGVFWRGDYHKREVRDEADEGK
jgi:hypothetical protein